MVGRRQSNGKILFGHYRYQRRHFAGDERLCYQPVTANERAAASKMDFNPVRKFVAGRDAPSGQWRAHAHSPVLAHACDWLTRSRAARSVIAI
jgi:hypothetical protein